jgi:hypothetical protein
VTGIPPEDLEAREVGKRFLIDRSGRDAPLVVTVRDGPVAQRYAPAELVAKLTERVAVLLKEMGGGVSPMFFAAIPGASIHLVFGDPDPLDPQGQLAVEITSVQAERVAELMDLEGDQLFQRALQIGSPVRQYNELTQLVQSEGITLAWAVRDRKPRVLAPDLAERQHSRLSAPTKTQDRGLVLNGTLYRVITESTREGFLGSVGIHLHSWSARPPGDRAKTRVIAFYEKPAVEEKIKAGLVGEPVRAELLIRQPIPGTSIDPERFDLVLDDLRSGPPEDEILGPGLFDDDG